MSILIIDDDVELCELVTEYLEGVDAAQLTVDGGYAIMG